MKKIICILIAVTLVVTFENAMASSYITDIKSTIQAEPYWKNSYDVYGKEVEVNIPIITPDVEKMPILIVKPRNPYSEQELFLMDSLEKNDNGNSMGWSFRDKGLYYYLNPESNEEGNAEFSQYKDEDVCMGISVSMNAPQERLNSVRKDNLKYAEKHIYPWDVDMKTTFAEDCELSLLDAIEYVNRILDYYYDDNSNGAYVEFVEIRDRARKTKTSNIMDMDMGDTVDYYPSGSYYLHLRPMVDEIPIYEIAANLHEKTISGFWENFCKYYFRILQVPLCSAEIMNKDSFYVNMLEFEKEQVIIDNAVLAPVSTIIEKIEDEIKKGKIRTVYALRLGYVCFLNDTSPESYTLFPTWICECEYTESANEEGSTYIADAGFREGTKFTRVGFNAQTGEIMDRVDYKWEDLFCPSVLVQ